MEAPTSAYSREVLDVVGRFVEDVEAESIPARAVIQNEIRQHRASVDSVNALIVVGAFISGVQVQIISSTSNSRNMLTQIVTSWFAFVGLMLDVFGTTTGMVHALVIQSAIRRHQRHLERLDAMGDARANLRRVLESSRRNASHQAESELRAKIQEGMRAQVTAYVEAQTSSANATLWRRFINAGKRVSPPIAFVVQLIDEIFSHLGRVPIALMSSGILCLTLCILCFAVVTQDQVVWISCVCIAGGMGLFALSVAAGYAVNAVMSDIRQRQEIAETSEQVAALLLPKAGQ